MLRITHNFGSFAYRTDLVKSDVGMHSWSALFDARWAERMTLVDEPAIGIFDAALDAR
jgi:putative spermidine/putrescine transport system substrate-binding protein